MKKLSLMCLLLGAMPLGAFADGLPRLRICTGSVGNTYHQVGTRLAEALRGAVAVEVLATRGSWENLDAIDAEPRRCDAIIAQEDAYTLYQFEKPKSTLMMDRMATLYQEPIHLVCNRRAGLKSAADLKAGKHTVLINSYGSGTYVTWKLLGKLNPAYGRLKAVESGMDEALLKVVDGAAAQCMVFVSAVGAKTLKMADEKYGDRLTLLSLEDDKLHRKVGREKRQIYRDYTLSKGAYRRLNDESIETQSVSAVFFVNPEWRARYPEAGRNLARVLVELIPKL